MTLDEFRAGLSQAAPPGSLAPALAALWWDARGDWTRAHEAVQSGADSASAWVHAYLHRKEGDLSNARYWYARAGRTPATGALGDEWAAIAAALLSYPAEKG